MQQKPNSLPPTTTMAAISVIASTAAATASSMRHFHSHAGAANSADGMKVNKKGK